MFWVRPSHLQPQDQIMERSNALRIINSLANGVNPATGEIFPADSPYQHPDTVRALFEAVRALEVPESRSTRSNDDMPAHTFVRWTPEEEERLAAGFDAGRSSAELAKLHNRSRAAIEARLFETRQNRCRRAYGANADAPPQ